MIQDDWARLLPGDPRVAEVAVASQPALALVADLAGEGRLRFGAGGRALLHSHCHEKALGFAVAHASCARLPFRDLEVEDPDAGCCGMSGVFGYEADHYELSVAMAEHRPAAGRTRRRGPRRSCLRPARRAGRRSATSAAAPSCTRSSSSSAGSSSEAGAGTRRPRRADDRNVR